MLRMSREIPIEDKRKRVSQVLEEVLKNYFKNENFLKIL